MKVPKPSLFFLLVALLIILHQYLFWGKIWEWKDIHHESFVILFIGLAIGVWFYAKRKMKYVKIQS